MPRENHRNAKIRFCTIFKSNLQQREMFFVSCQYDGNCYSRFIFPPSEIVFFIHFFFFLMNWFILDMSDNNTIILELMHILKKGVQTWSFLKQYWTFQWIWRRITNKLLTSWLCYRVTSDSHFICLVCDSVVSVHNVQQSMAFDKTFMFYSFKAFIHHCS